MPFCRHLPRLLCIALVNCSFLCGSNWFQGCYVPARPRQCQRKPRTRNRNTGWKGLIFQSYTCHRSCIWHFNTWQFHVCLTFQYLTVSCIPAIGRVYDISIPDSFMYLTFLGMMPDSHWYIASSWQFVVNLFWTVADILQHVPSMVPDIDFSWHFMVLYVGKISIISMYVNFPARNGIFPVCYSPKKWCFAYSFENHF